MNRLVTMGPNAHGMHPGFFVFALLLLFCASWAAAVVPEGQMKIYAVTTEGQGLVATLGIKIEPGTGKIWSAVTPLVGTATQNAERTAVMVAQREAKKNGNYDYKFSIDSSASVVDGPSAGAAMTLLTASMLSDQPLPGNVSLTGTISESGSVGVVGGIYEKAKEASRTGTKLFLIPKGEAVQTVRLPEGVKSVNILDYAPKNWGMKVVEVRTIGEAMKVAHSKIEDIDVNSDASQAIPEFVPEKLTLDPRLGEFKLLTTNYIKKTKQASNSARQALSSSLIEDGSLIHDMLEILNNADQTLSRADILNEQNYLYSAANFAFLARVNAKIVEDVSSDPKILEADSDSLDIKLVELRRELGDFEEQLGGDVPKDGAEWFASAQQRFSYSRNAVERLSAWQIVVVGGGDEEKRQAALERLRDYEFAKAWLDVAKDFYALAKSADNFVMRQSGLRPDAQGLISEAEILVFAVPEGDPAKQDIQRRFEAAKSEFDMNWFEAAMYDAASAKALASAEKDTNGIGNTPLRDMLEKKIAQVDSVARDSNARPGWPGLYLAHAKYFLSSANYYENAGQPEIAQDNMRSGYGLALLAEEELLVSLKVSSLYSKLTPREKPKPGTPEKFPEEKTDAQSPWIASLVRPLAGILLLVAALIAIAVTVAALSIASAGRQSPVAAEIEKSRQMLKSADARFMQGKITQDEHNNLKREYGLKIASLESERSAHAAHILAVDEYSAGIDSYKTKLKGLKAHLKDGTISAEEFRQRSGNYMAGMDALQKKLASEIGAINSEGHGQSPLPGKRRTQKGQPRAAGKGGKGRASK